MQVKLQPCNVKNPQGHHVTGAKNGIWTFCSRKQARPGLSTAVEREIASFLEKQLSSVFGQTIDEAFSALS